MNYKKYITLLLPLLLLSGCMNKHIYMPMQAGGEGNKVYRLKTEHPFHYPRQSIKVSNHTLYNLGDEFYRVRHIRFSSFGESGQPDNQVSVLYYQSKARGKKKLVIVLPIWGSYTYPSRKIAGGILARSRGDTNVMFVVGEKHLFDWTGMSKAKTEDEFRAIVKRMAYRFKSHVIDIRRMIDWAIDDGGVKPGSVGIVGFSMSALEAISVLFSDERIAAGVLVMGGSHPHEVFTTCDGKVEMVRNAIMQRFNWSKAQYMETFRKEFIVFDTTGFAGTVDPRKVIMFDAHNDDCMSKRSRNDLWHDLGKPERYSFLYNHKKSFYSMTPLGSFFMRYRIYEFLDRRLK